MKKLFALSLCITNLLFSQVDHSVHWKAEEYHFHSEEQFLVARNIVENLPLKGTESVLDIGCGDGKITAMIQSRVPNGRVVGVDISPSMISYAKGKFSSVEFELKDAHLIDYSNEFDLVVSFTAMQWITNQEQALSGIFKALKPEGRMIIEMPQGLPALLQVAVDKVKHSSQWHNYFIGYTPNWRFYECEEYQSLIEETGLEVESIDSREITHTFPSKRAFVGFLQQWFPYLSRIPTQEEKQVFLVQVVDEYLKNCKARAPEVPFKVRRLNAKAKKPLEVGMYSTHFLGLAVK